MTTVDVERIERTDWMGSPEVVIKTSKNKGEYTISKSNTGFVFYHIKVSKGPLPASLQGQFSRLKFAEKALMEHLRTSKKTISVRRDETYEKNHPTKKA